MDSGDTKGSEKYTGKVLKSTKMQSRLVTNISENSVAVSYGSLLQLLIMFENTKDSYLVFVIRL